MLYADNPDDLLAIAAPKAQLGGAEQPVHDQDVLVDAAVDDLRLAVRPKDEQRRHLLDDGRLELDTNPVENQIRPIALTRKNALFAGNEIGAENWAMLASLVATCKLADVNPVDYIAATLRAILNGHPKSDIEDLMPWRFKQPSSIAA